MISVVIPYFNHQDAIEATLRSIASQKGVQLEVVLIDDGSDIRYDETRLQNIILHRVVRHETNKGAPAARNTGLAAASGKYVIFWDADVVADPSMLSKMQILLDNNPDLSFVYSSFVFGPKTFVGQPFSHTSLKQRNYIHSTSVLRRDIAPNWDESLIKFQDWDYWLTLAAEGFVGYFIDEVLFTVGQRKTGMSNWLPRIAYYAPFRWLPYVRPRVKKYKNAESIIRQKHSL